MSPEAGEEAAPIRPMRADETDAVAALCVTAFAPIHAGFAVALGERIFAAEYAGWKDRYASIVAEIAVNPDARIHVAGDPPLAFVATTLMGERGAGEITLSAVAPAAQRRGLGLALVRFALADLAARGATYAFVGTGGDAAHGPARALYEAAGFDRTIPAVHYFREL